MADTNTCELPPLILHPFTNHDGAARLAANSRASLMLLDMMPGDGSTRHEQSARVLEARLLELRMLYFLGKDVQRWIGQCVEAMHGETGIYPQSFAALLIRNTPEHVRRKLCGWGVNDYAMLFSRALGINLLFREPPAPDLISDEFALNYHRYADALFACYQRSHSFAEPGPERFTFQIYGSREYSQLLEQQWGGLEEPPKDVS